MTREEIITAIVDALTSAPRTTPSKVLQALRDAGQFIEDGAAATTTPSEKLVAFASRLEESAGIRISPHDSDSRIARINESRVALMLEVARELRAIP